SPLVAAGGATRLALSGRADAHSTIQISTSASLPARARHSATYRPGRWCRLPPGRIAPPAPGAREKEPPAALDRTSALSPALTRWPGLYRALPLALVPRSGRERT